MPTRQGRSRFDDIARLRGELPPYWWAEVTRVRALIEQDADVGLLEARHFGYAAQALADAGDDDARNHVHALCAASYKLAQIAEASRPSA